MNEQTITARDLGTEEALSLAQDRGGRLYVDDERVWLVSALEGGIIALTTGIRTVYISAADYWRVLHGDASPSPQSAGVLAARLTYLERCATDLIEALVHDARISPASYPTIWERVQALRTALGAAGAAPAEP